VDIPEAARVLRETASTDRVVANFQRHIFRTYKEAKVIVKAYDANIPSL